MKKRQICFMLIMCFLISSFSIDSKAASSEEWKTEPFMLTAKYAMHCVTIGKNVYFIGGAGEGVARSVSTDIYNIVTKTWSKGKDMPNAFYLRAYTEYNGKIYLFGGYDASANTYGTVDIYNPVSDSWSVGKTMPYPVYNAQAVSIGDSIYVFGGITADNKNYIQIYNTINYSWTTKIMPFASRQATLESYNGKVYLIGGNDGTRTIDDVNIYNPATNEWSKGKNMPTERSGLTSVMKGSKIYAIAGRNLMNEDKTTQSIAAVEVYDIIEDNWSKLISLPLGRRLPSSAFVDGRIYVFGGRNQETVDYLDSVVSLKIEDEVSTEGDDLQVLLYPGEEAQLSISFDLGDNKTYEWSSSNSEVASVDEDGKVTAISKGATNIEVRNKANTYMENIALRVIDDKVDPRIAVYLRTGQTLRLYMKDDPLTVNWLSMDPSVATISSTGQVVGVSKGMAIIKATVDNIEKFIYVRVSE